MRAFCAGLLASLAMVVSGCTSHETTTSHPGELVRETQSVLVDGVVEDWQLVWIGPPKPICSTDDFDLALTCPCSGLAYGQAGNLWLVRKRKGVEVERMDLRPLFGDNDLAGDAAFKNAAFVQGQPVKDGDYDRYNNDGVRLAEEITHRAPVRLMTFADYDRDGHASEFLLQVATLPCGKLQFVAIGTSRTNPHLHAFSTASDAAPLVMPIHAWQAMLTATSPTTVRVWDCGDHGSEYYDDLIVFADHGVISERDRHMLCSGKASDKAY